MLSLASDAIQRCVPVEIDHPQTGLQVRKDALYRDWFDRVGLFGKSFADIFHRRSYDVSARNVFLDRWGKYARRSYVHLTPHPYTLKTYDPCLFHALFRPDDALQSEINQHRKRMGERAIGLHLRTGDSAAFGITNKDVRASNEGLEKAVGRMLECADRLASRLYSESRQKREVEVTYYLATDSSRAKDLAVKIAKERIGSNESNQRARVYTTAVDPQSYLRGPSGDRGAWMEVFLLSMLDGIVMNLTPEKGYEGTASKVSTFSMLARGIGMIPDDKMEECVLQ